MNILIQSSRLRYNVFTGFNERQFSLIKAHLKRGWKDGSADKVFTVKT